MKQNELFSYTYDFVSRILDNKPIFDSVRRIILFGSVVRGDFTNESDVDIFIDVYPTIPIKEITGLVKKEINKFESKAEKTWHIRGINLPLKIIVDDFELEKWKELREEVSSYGKIIFGKFEQPQTKKEQKLLITYDIKNISQKNKMSFLRALYGYTLKKEGKKYIQYGLMTEINGEKLNPGTL